MTDEEFELMGDLPREDPNVAEVTKRNLIENVKERKTTLAFFLASTISKQRNYKEIGFISFKRLLYVERCVSGV